jgi:hypothetical protein
MAKDSPELAESLGVIDVLEDMTGNDHIERLVFDINRLDVELLRSGPGNDVGRHILV